MYRTDGIYHRRSLWYALCLAGLLCFWLLGSLSVFAASVPGGNVSDPAVRGADIARPAIVRIITTLKGKLTVHFPPTTDVTFPQQTNGGYDLAFSGTGTFISSQGDILTADHVIRPPQDQDLNADLYATAADDIAKYMNQNAQAGTAQVTKDQVTQQLTSGQLQSTPTYGQPSSQAFLSTDYTGPLTVADFQSLPAGVALTVDQIKQESPVDQADTAIIHVPMQDTPSVPLGKSADVQALDQLTKIGFPGNADINGKPGDLLTPSLNSVQVSAKKNGVSGSPVIQVSGNIGHGDSGGPTLNSEGQIVGIVSYVQTDKDTGASAQFLQASQSAQTMVDALKLNVTPGTFQNMWSQAFQDYYAATTTGHWSKVKQEFDQLAQKYPLFKAVQPYQQYASQQAQTEVVSTPTVTATVQATVTASAHEPSSSSQPRSITSSLPAIALAVGGSLAVLILAGVLFAVIVRPRKRKKQEAAAPGQVEKEKASESPGVTGSPAPSTPPVATPASNQGSTKQPVTPVPPAQPSANPPTPVPAQAGGQPTQAGQQTLALKIWPCGHMNRPTARFCSICGEAAPSSPGSTTLH